MPGDSKSPFYFIVENHQPTFPKGHLLIPPKKVTENAEFDKKVHVSNRFFFLIEMMNSSFSSPSFAPSSFPRPKKSHRSQTSQWWGCHPRGGDDRSLGRTWAGGDSDGWPFFFFRWSWSGVEIPICKNGAPEAYVIFVDLSLVKNPFTTKVLQRP